jgi:16S rRNA (uracil1498-N3)-methyltransferase
MIFYAPDIENDRRLPEEESQHAVKVLRLKEGDKIEIVDGKGCFYHAEITFPHAKHCEVEILSKTENFQPQPVHLHIAIAPTKNMDRLEWFAEKVTEIGVGEITPLLCERSERKVLKHDRLEKILVSAMKQSKKAYLPRLNELKKFSDFVKENSHGNRFIAHCYEEDKKELVKEYVAGEDAVVLIGPEGDFGEKEVAVALKAGFVPVSLGESRLRTETAGVVACHTVQLINQLAKK